MVRSESESESASAMGAEGKAIRGGGRGLVGVSGRGRGDFCSGGGLSGWGWRRGVGGVGGSGGLCGRW